MTPEQASELLGRIALIDGRTFTAAHAVTWAELLVLDSGEPITLRDAVIAAMDYHRHSTYPIKPADVIRHVKAMRRARIGDDPIPVPPVDPADTAAYIGWVKAWTRARGDGADSDIASTVADREIGVSRHPEAIAARAMTLPTLPRP